MPEEEITRASSALEAARAWMELAEHPDGQSRTRIRIAGTIVCGFAALFIVGFALLSSGLIPGEYHLLAAFVVLSACLSMLASAFGFVAISWSTAEGLRLRAMEAEMDTLELLSSLLELKESVDDAEQKKALAGRIAEDSTLPATECDVVVGLVSDLISRRIQVTLQHITSAGGREGDSSAA